MCARIDEGGYGHRRRHPAAFDLDLCDMTYEEYLEQYKYVSLSLRLCASLTARSCSILHASVMYICICDLIPCRLCLILKDSEVSGPGQVPRLSGSRGEHADASPASGHGSGTGVLPGRPPAGHGHGYDVRGDGHASQASDDVHGGRGPRGRAGVLRRRRAIGVSFFLP